MTPAAKDRSRSRRLALSLLSAAAFSTLRCLAQTVPAPAGAPVTQRSPQAGRDADRPSQRDELARALTVAEQESEAAQRALVTALYRVAQLHARLGNRLQAYDALRRAHDAGVLDADAMRRDPAFSSMRGEERFQQLAKAVRTKRYIAMLERRERDVFQKPEEVIRTLALRPGERVADVGAGSGYFTLRAAWAVGSTGTVLAIDIDSDLLDFLGRRASEAGLANVRTRLVSADDPGLPPAGIDTVLLVDTFHYVKDRPTYAKKLRAGLAAGGRVVVIDYLPWSECPGAPQRQRRVSRESVDDAMRTAGLVPAKVHDFLPEQFFIEYVAP